MGKKLKLFILGMIAAPIAFQVAGITSLAIFFAGMDIGILGGYIGCAYQLYRQLQKASKQLGAVMGAMENAQKQRKKRSKADSAASKTV